MSAVEYSECLFSYGTLQDVSVQFDTFGRKLSGEPDVLQRFQQGRVPIVNSPGQFHLNAEFTGRDSDQIAGTVFLVSMSELDQADVYEATANYKRVRVELRSGKKAWVYVNDAS